MQYHQIIKKIGIISIVGCAALAAGAAVAQAAPDPTGDWDLEIDMGGTPMLAKLEVIRNDDGTLSGSLNSPLGPMSLEKVAYVSGETLSFSETIGEGDTAMELKFEGSFDGPDAFHGVLESTMGPMAIKGKRHMPESPVAGVWKVTSESQLGSLERELIVYKSGKAKYASDEQAWAVTDLAVDGDAVTFNVTVEVQGQELALSFQGAYEGDELNGEFMVDGSSAAKVTATRQPAPGLDTIWGDWDIRADTPLGELIAKLTFGKDKSTLTTDEGETEVANIELDVDFVQFAVNIVFEGGEYDVNFEGYLKEDVIDGDFLMGGSPVAQVTAMRQSSE